MNSDKDESEKFQPADEDVNKELAPVPEDKPAQATDTPSLDGTLGQLNALASAESYLAFSAFSYNGLVEQLEFEQLTHDEAVYAADNCGADWNAQAEKSAKSYLSFSAFSYQGLIEQLEFEGFTTEQATYGADMCGADWNEQAAKSAKSYLSLSSFSRDGLIDHCKVQAVIDVNFDGRRTDAIRQTAAFANYVKQVEQVMSETHE